MKLMMTNHCSSTDICLCSSKTLLIRQTIMPPGIIILVGLIKYRKISKKTFVWATQSSQLNLPSYIKVPVVVQGAWTRNAPVFHLVLRF